MAEETRRGHSIRIESIASLIDDPSLSVLREGLVASSHSAPEFASLAASTDEEAQALIIDGKIIPYVRTQEGYRVYYQPPAETLLDAARSYVDTQRKVAE